MRAIIYRPGKPPELHSGVNPADWKKFVTQALDGADLEHVSVLADFDLGPTSGKNFRRSDMFVDERGHDKQLEHNEIATRIYQHYATKVKRESPCGLSTIAGTAILFDTIVWR